MTILLTALHVGVCLFLIFVVLLQSAQAADLAGAFGGGGSQTALGMRGATTLLQKATTAAAVIFMLTSLGLGLAERSTTSLIEGLDGPAPAAVESDAAIDPAPGVDGPAAVEGAVEGAEAAGEGEQAGDEGEGGAEEQDESGGEQ
jgi:preprotein translocase subunit SecG